MGRKISLRYFYLNGDLHRTIHVDRAGDLITSWNYPKVKRMTYVYSQVKKDAGRTFTLKETAKMLNHGRLALERALMRGDVRAPQLTYGIDEDKNKHKYLLSEDDVMEFHRYFLTVHRGRPRNDGIVTPTRMPNERELRAMMRQQVILYVKTDEDTFVPSWQAETF